MIYEILESQGINLKTKHEYVPNVYMDELVTQNPSRFIGTINNDYFSFGETEEEAKEKSALEFIKRNGFNVNWDKTIKYYYSVWSNFDVGDKHNQRFFEYLLYTLMLKSKKEELIKLAAKLYSNYIGVVEQ